MDNLMNSILLGWGFCLVMVGWGGVNWLAWWRWPRLSSCRVFIFVLGIFWLMLKEKMLVLRLSGSMLLSICSLITRLLSNISCFSYCIKPSERNLLYSSLCNVCYSSISFNSLFKRTRNYPIKWISKLSFSS